MNSSIINPGFTKPYSHIVSHGFPKSFPPTGIITEDPGMLIYTLAHEIRNPLTNINLAIQVLRQIVKNDDQAIYLDIIMRNSARIKDIVTDLLTSGNTNEVRPKTHSVRCLLEEVLAINEDRFVLKNITVRKNYCTRDLKIKLDHSQVKIALTNIIINAIEAMPANTNNGLLEITTKLLHGICFIVIKDNGTGISKENLNNIFKPYFTSKPGGVGLGLSGTLSILNSNRIGINVRSDVGRGARFILSYKTES